MLPFDALLDLLAHVELVCKKGPKKAPPTFVHPHAAHVCAFLVRVYAAVLRRPYPASTYQGSRWSGLAAKMCEAKVAKPCDPLVGFDRKVQGGVRKASQGWEGMTLHVDAEMAEALQGTA